MNGNCTRNTTATRPPRRTTKRVVLAGRLEQGTKVADHLRKLGWEVLTVGAGGDVHAAAAEVRPHAILVAEDGAESGYLACAKLLQSQPQLRVVVVGERRTPRGERFAEFVGASFVAETDGANELAAAVE
jgi:hypothetical protein